MADAGYRRRYAAAVAEMRNAGVRRWDGQPPIVRLLQRLGLKPRPPYYQTFGSVLVWFGAYFTLSLFIFACIVRGGHSRHAIVADGIAALIAGLFFGTVMAVWYRSARVRKRLSEWDDLL